MFAEERKTVIVSAINNGVPVKVGELSQKLGVSESTIRRDLQELEDNGLIQRTHGGAISVRTGFEPSFTDKEVVNLAEKQAIAEAAAKLIQDGEAVFLDAGTTTLEIARLLRERPVTIVTNSMEVVQVFLDDSRVEVMLLGGVFRKATRSLVGYMANEMLKRMHFDKVFLAANAVSAEYGVATPNPAEAETKRQMVDSGHKVILVADHSKIGQRALCRICGLEEISLVLTDAGIEPEDYETLKAVTEVGIAGRESKK
jgi:DeoR family fructose operon transcriptional repressor